MYFKHQTDKNTFGILAPRMIKRRSCEKQGYDKQIDVKLVVVKGSNNEDNVVKRKKQEKKIIAMIRSMHSG